MKKWILPVALCGSLLGGCAVKDFIFGPPASEKEKADVNKDGILSEQERKDAGLPPDGSPWIETALKILGALGVPGMGITAMAYQKARQQRALFESVVSGVDEAVKAAPEIKEKLYGKLQDAARSGGIEKKIAKEVERVKRKIRKAATPDSSGAGGI